jgi:hypothetical protein
MYVHSVFGRGTCHAAERSRRDILPTPYINAQCINEMITILSTSLRDKVITWKGIKKENVIAHADTKYLAKKCHVQNCSNIMKAIIINNAFDIITSSYNINKEWSNHNPPIQLTEISLLVHPAAFGNMNCI